jgi:MFS family permease
MTMPAILARFGYRTVLISNTILLGLLILSFATVGARTPIWLIVVQSLFLGFFSSLQYTSVNTLVYADITSERTSAAATIASTVQQMSLSFGVALASLATAFFIPNRFASTPGQMIGGTHKAFLVLGAITLLSTVVYLELKSSDGANASRHEDVVHAH